VIAWASNKDWLTEEPSQPRAVEGEVGASAGVRRSLPWPCKELSCPSSISLRYSSIFLSVKRLNLAHLQALFSFKLILLRKKEDSVNGFLFTPITDFSRLLKLTCQTD